MDVRAASHETGPVQAGAVASSGETADQEHLFAWAEEVCGGEIVRSSQTSGGNRARSWALDVRRPDGTVAEAFLRYAPPRPAGVEPYTIHREAQVYRAIRDAGIRAPTIIAEHPTIQAILTDRASGIAEFRRLKDPTAKQAIIREVMADLARLHARPTAGVRLDGGAESSRIADHVRAEIAIWRAMYEETGRRDALLELAFRWLDGNLPDPDGPVALVHGDAGPGNFLFEDGRLTALIDWELAHLGDPMDDLAWLSMRCVMEPVPDFADALTHYQAAGGATLDVARILYHRVLVSTRVVVIRHRNVTGEPALAIVSRALNRRLLVDALSEASAVPIVWPPGITLPPTPETELFDGILADLRDVIVPRSQDGRVISRAKSAAKVVKYLQAVDRYGSALARAERDALAACLPDPPGDLDDARQAFAEAVAADRIPFARALDVLAGQAARDAQLAAGPSGGIAARHYPPLPPQGHPR